MEVNTQTPWPQLGALCKKDEGKWMWKLDGMNGKRKGWMGAGHFVENPHCQRLYFEVKMHQITLGGRASPGPAGGV